jgi:predicted transposase/invertase (TIGR01784 family)
MPFILDREIDPLYQEGVEKGLERGKAEGIRKRNLEIAKTMLAQKLPLDMIVSVTGLEKEVVEKLLAEIDSRNNSQKNCS